MSDVRIIRSWRQLAEYVEELAVVEGKVDDNILAAIGSHTKRIAALEARVAKLERRP